MDLEVAYTKVEDQAEAFKKVKAQITPDTIKKFKVNAKIDYQSPDLITATGKGFTLNLHFNATACEVETKLSLLLKPMKGKILEALERELKRVI